VADTLTAEAVLANIVGGRRIPVEGAETLDVLDPATGRSLARVPLSGAADVDSAVTEAARA
jgi:acyl-CoA reductase-like NAD-dependent aldehyde dehydrogenase